MNEIDRYYNELASYCQAGKVLIIYGARQIGKTTLVQHYLANTELRYKLDSGDNLLSQHFFANANFNDIADYVSGYDLIVIDEAQEITNIGHSLKIMVDQHPHLRIIVTGSSSFDLANQVGEPLTDRQRVLQLYPIAQLELIKHMNRFELKQAREQFLLYGAYPEIITASSTKEKINLLKELTQAYLLKDILTLEKIKNSKTLLDLLKLLAFQVGSEVSLSQLAQQLMIDVKTVMRYIDLLEKTFIIFSLRGFSRNLRKEVTKKSKYYFYDLGIRNCLIANFSKLEQRQDLGALWENFLLVERIKKQCYEQIICNNYFWRTWDQQEIDLIEDRDGKLFAYEVKWKRKNKKIPKAWQDNYADSEFTIIHQDNYLDFVC